MRVFISEGDSRWEYQERQVKEKGTEKYFTLTQPKELFSEDYYTVRRAIAVENVPFYIPPEKDFYVYEFSYMETGCCLYVITVDEDTAKELISTCLKEFMQGNASSYIKYFFDERLGK